MYRIAYNVILQVKVDTGDAAAIYSEGCAENFEVFGGKSSYYENLS